MPINRTEHPAARWLAGMLLVAWCCLVAALPARAAGIGSVIADVDSLRDLHGRRRSLHSFQGYRAIVLIFVGVDCPLANLYLPTVSRLSREYLAQGALFVAVYPHEHETLDGIAAHACDRDLPCLVVKDIEQRLADTLGVTRTPEVCVLDERYALRYRGRINDQYGVNFRRPQAQREDLRMALDELLAQRAVSVPESPVDGCLLDRRSAQQEPRPLTFDHDIAPLLATHCQKCHQPDRAAPFSLASHDDAVRWSAMIREVVSERRMPPWQADGRYGQFLNDRRMPAKDVATLVSWIDSGLGPGAGRPLPPPPSARGRWSISQVDALLAGDKRFDVPADGTLPYQHTDMDSQQARQLFQEDRWVQEAEVLPDDPAVVHHIMVFVVPPGWEGPPASLEGIQVLSMWAPGEPSFRFPADTAALVPRGSRLVTQIHFQPNGQAIESGVKLAIRFAPGKPEWQVAMRTHENRGFRLPPHDPHVRCETMFIVDQPVYTRLIGLYPHLHLRGKSYYFVARFPDGRKETLLSVPRYDFNWQTLYWFDKPVELPLGTHLRAVAHWDNSRENLSNPDPSREVRYGFQSDDEMMVAGMMFLFRPEEAQGAQE